MPISWHMEGQDGRSVESAASQGYKVSSAEDQMNKTKTKHFLFLLLFF